MGKQYKIDIYEIFDEIKDKGYEDKCTDCDLCKYIKDPFMTGDSPAIKECEGYASNCPIVWEKVDEIKLMLDECKWMLPYIFEDITSD